ncbi:MAG: glycosyltransferase [Planctomycetota bacterium]|jgi:glycosyltransferase involved in cell wall biosynthesis
MTRIRLIRKVDRPSGRGPGNGQCALQKALCRRKVDWLLIGGRPKADETPWFWCWADRRAAALWARRKRPFVAGPNVLFDHSRAPGAGFGERDVLHAESCRLLFTESQWYRRLIDRHRGPLNRAPIVVWPYPIDPRPDGPLHPTEYDLLIYAKSDRFSELAKWLAGRYARSRIVRYGHYQRPRLWQLARRARCCVYLSDDDRGPLALAEILLCGCPTIGVPTGAPFVRHGRTGVVLNRLTMADCVEAIEYCHDLDRCRVAHLAAEQFDTDRIVKTILEALDRIRR